MPEIKLTITDDNGVETACDNFYALLVTNSLFGKHVINYAHMVDVDTIAIASFNLVCEVMDLSPKKALKYIHVLYKAAEIQSTIVKKEGCGRDHLHDFHS